MKRRHFLGMILPAVMAAGCGYRPFHFIQLADTQLGMINGGADGNEFSKETEMLEKVLSQINRIQPKPAFAVVCGDLTNLPAHMKQIAEYKRLMGLLNSAIPYYNVSGNHDFTGNPNTVNLDFYRKTFGPDWYSFEVSGWNFVVLNSTLMKFPEGCQNEADKQFNWLKTTLADARSHMLGTIVFMHHPFFDNTIDEEDGYHAITRTSRRLYLDLFAENNVKAVFSGHRHTTIPERSYSTVRLINTNAVCNSFDSHPGLRVVKVLKNSIHHEFYPYDKLPVTVSMTV